VSLTAAPEARLTGAIHRALGRRPVILLGSRAIGTARAASDYDVLVVMPLVRIPFVLRRLKRVAMRLGEELGVPVSVNPLPASRLKRRTSLFTWKVRTEGRVLWAPTGFDLTDPGRAPLDNRARFSYAASAALFLLEAALLSGAERTRRLEKCLLHLAQLRLLETDRYEPTLERALAALGDRRFADASGFAAIRALLVQELEPLLGRVATTDALRVNARYATLAAIRRRARAAGILAREAADVSLMRRALTLLLSIDHDAVDDATERSIRHVLAEWPDAHPLAAQ
jgi:predicted nucleotidyltransferase